MMLRSFIAIELPPEIQKAIANNTAMLQQMLPRPLVRWVPSGNVHLTLRFLGDVSSSNLERLAEALEIEVGQHNAFPMSVGELGIFPNPKRPRIVWIGLETPPELQALQRGTEAVCARLGYTPEDRPLSPHLTIGRVNQNINLAEIQHIRAALEQVQVGMLGTVNVDAIRIFKSDLQPTGAVYTPLYTLQLKTA
jgi:2'-5' RNA ligase